VVNGYGASILLYSALNKNRSLSQLHFNFQARAEENNNSSSARMQGDLLMHAH
jgi:hypothetical protein